MQARPLFRSRISRSHYEAHLAEKSCDCFMEWHCHFHEYLPSPMISVVWQPCGEKYVCVDVPRSAVIKHWHSLLKRAEETRKESLMPTSIVRGALLDNLILAGCRVCCFFLNIRGLVSPEGTEGEWSGWNYLDMQHRRVKAPSPRAWHMQLHLLNIPAASGLHPENCCSTALQNMPPHSH